MGGDDEEPPKPRKTHRGYHSPSVDDPPRDSGGASGMFDDETVVEESPRGDGPRLEESGELYIPPDAKLKAPRPITDDVPLVEVEVLHQVGRAPKLDQPAEVLEVWTQNRIYTMDPSMTCVKVAARDGKADPEHPFLGYKLVGGQHRDGESFEISYPYPRPGTEAVFEHPEDRHGMFSRTSTVVRVVLRLHVVTVQQRVLVPTWSRITNHEIQLPPDKPRE